MKDIYIKNEYITLGQFLKLCGAVDSGVTAKFVIQDGAVLVNNEVEMRRGKKLRDGDIVEYEGVSYKVKNED